MCKAARMYSMVEKAAENGDVQAQHNIAMAYIVGNELSKTINKLLFGLKGVNEASTFAICAWAAV